MVYIFKFISSEEPDFELDVKVSGTHTFADLHNAIQKTLHFDKMLLASFFVSNANWEKLQEITLMDMGEGGVLMDNARIADFYGKKGQRIMYVFDYFAERMLFGSVVSVADGDVKDACVTKLDGHIPPQLAPGNDVFDDDELFSGEEMTSDDFDPDELSDDMEGFDEY